MPNAAPAPTDSIPVPLGSVVVTDLVVGSDPWEPDQRGGAVFGLIDPRNRRRVALVGALTLAVLLAGGLGVFVFAPGGGAPHRAADAAPATSPAGTEDAAPEPTLTPPDPGSPTPSPNVSRSPARARTPAASAAAPIRLPDPATTPPDPAPTTKAASPPVIAPCGVHLDVTEWADGANLTLQITNTGSKPYDSWTLTFKMTGGLKLKSGGGWNGDWKQSGETVTVKNASHNGDVAPGGSVQIGTGVTGTGDKRSKISNAFTVNGKACDSK